MNYKYQIIIICQSLIIVLLLLYLYKINNENELRKDYLELKSKKFEDLTKIEYNRINEYFVLISKGQNKGIDTISYEEAKYKHENLKILVDEWNTQYELKKNNCNENLLINSFHNMMTFNHPYEKYDKDSINIESFDNCTIRVNVTTQEPKYGLRTFWIFEVYFDESENKFKMQKVKSEFLG